MDIHISQSLLESTGWLGVLVLLLLLSPLLVGVYKLLKKLMEILYKRMRQQLR